MSKHMTMRKTALAALALVACSAWAAPVVGPADDTFFNAVPAAQLPGQAGALISYRTTTANLGADAPANQAWNVVYQSTDSRNQALALSGTVFVPSAAWTGAGPRPTIMYAVGTHGQANRCAPSRQFATGTDYENHNIKAALKAGYAVVVSDYRGGLNGVSSTYIAGKAQGSAIIDIFRAASQIPSSGISTANPAAIWGYSQGGQTAAWAAELLPTYAPELKVVGVAAGGIPGDLNATALNLDKNLGFAFLGGSINGLNNQYPGSVPINLLSNDAGKAALAKIANSCVFEALFEFQNKGMADYTNDGFGIAELLEVETVANVVGAQKLGRGNIGIPMYQYHGQADEFIPLAQAFDLKKTYCAKGTKVAFDLYPSEHIATQFQAAPQSLSWIADRLAGKPAPDTCGATGAPVPTANPGGGNFVVTLDKWPLTAYVDLKTLNQRVTMSPASTFSAQSDITAKKLDGALSLPEVKQKLKIIGIPLDFELLITPVGKVEGSVALDNAGILNIDANAKVDILVRTMGALGLQLPFNCKTSTPVNFPIKFTGPISALGSGGLNFKGETSFPSITGCSLFSPIFSLFMSGSGQKYDFTVAPPAPVKF